jgi:hypothetical protein
MKKEGIQFAKGGQVGDNVLNLQKGDVFKIIDQDHTQTYQDFVFLDYTEKLNKIALKVIPLSLIIRQKFAKDDIIYIVDISSDGIKLLDEKQLSIQFKKYINNFLMKIGEKLPYSPYYAKGGHMAKGGLTNIQGNAPVMKYPEIKSQVTIVE